MPRPQRAPLVAVLAAAAVGAAAVALALGLLAPRVALAGDFVDVRLNFTLTNENVLVRPGETNPSVPGWRIGAPNSLGILFFDNYDTRYTGYENLGHLVLYKKMLHGGGHFETEGAFVLRLYQFTDVNLSTVDAGSYIKSTYFFDASRGRKTNLSVTAFPLSSDRFRLGYSYKISWGGSPVFFKPNPDNPAASSAFTVNTNPVPGIKLQLAGERYYAFVGAKTSVLLNAESNEQEAVGAFLAGGGFDITDWFRVELNGGYFGRGVNPKQSVLGEPVQLVGGSVQLSFHQGIPVLTSVDYQLYRNDPESVQRYFLPIEHPRGFSWLAAAEFTYTAQTLENADQARSTKWQPAMAADLNLRFRYNFWRFKLDAMYRDLAYILQNVPSFSPYQDFSKEQNATPEAFAAAGVDYFFSKIGLTLGLTFGIDWPAAIKTPQLPTAISGNNPTSLAQKDVTVIVRNEGDFTILPPGKGPVPIFAGKLSARLDFAKYFAVIAEVLVSRDENRDRLVRATKGYEDIPENERPFERVFIDPNQLGFNFTLQAKF